MSDKAARFSVRSRVISISILSANHDRKLSVGQTYCVLEEAERLQ
jgi:hypothetical protein